MIEYYNKCLSDGHQVTFFCGDEISFNEYRQFKDALSKLNLFSDDAISVVSWMEERLMVFIGLTVCSRSELSQETVRVFNSLKSQ